MGPTHPPVQSSRSSPGRPLLLAHGAVCDCLLTPPYPAVWASLFVLCRLVSCPSLLPFLVSPLNVIDLVSIVPWYVEAAMEDSGMQVGQGAWKARGRGRSSRALLYVACQETVACWWPGGILSQRVVQPVPNSRSCSCHGRIACCGFQSLVLGFPVYECHARQHPVPRLPASTAPTTARKYARKYDHQRCVQHLPVLARLHPESRSLHRAPPYSECCACCGCFECSSWGPGEL